MEREGWDEEYRAERDESSPDGRLNLALSEQIALACTLEVCASKAGNVHRGADFEDATLIDFLVSGLLVARPLSQAAQWGVGKAVWEAVRTTRAATGTNTNLGILLLLAPLAAAAEATGPLRRQTANVLAQLSPLDSRYVYRAIALARPGGLGDAACPELDVRTGAAPESLLQAMREAADDDRLARQYITDYEDIWETVVPRLRSSLQAQLPWHLAIVVTQLHTLSLFGDSLIARKCGRHVSDEVAARASRVLAAGDPGQAEFSAALADLDFWLRADGHRRNPGTTADLITAALFVGLHEGWIDWPLEWSRLRQRSLLTKEN